MLATMYTLHIHNDEILVFSSYLYSYTEMKISISPMQHYYNPSNHCTTQVS